VDADACQKVIKVILFRAAERTGVAVILVANQPLTVPRIASLRVLQVSQGFDVADNEIVRRVTAGDLVITADIPLAAEVIAKGGNAVNPRGERYSPDTILGLLNLRDFTDTARAAQVCLPINPATGDPGGHRSSCPRSRITAPHCAGRPSACSQAPKNSWRTSSSRPR
jgi:hypothetical protein